jgi:hypothetical protein
LQFPGRAHPPEALDLDRVERFGIGRKDVLHGADIIPPDPLDGPHAPPPVPPQKPPPGD